MKKADLVRAIAAGTSVALKDGYAPENERPPRGAKEAKVVAVDVEPARWNAPRRVRVRIVSGVRDPERDVLPRDVLMPWSEYVELCDARDRARAAKEEAEQERQERATAAARALSGRAVGYSTAVRIDVEDAEVIVGELLTRDELIAVLAQAGLPGGLAHLAQGFGEEAKFATEGRAKLSRRLRRLLAAEEAKSDAQS